MSWVCLPATTSMHVSHVLKFILEVPTVKTMNAILSPLSPNVNNFEAQVAD